MMFKLPIEGNVKINDQIAQYGVPVLQGDKVLDCVATGKRVQVYNQNRG